VRGRVKETRERGRVDSLDVAPFSHLFVSDMAEAPTPRTSLYAAPLRFSAPQLTIRACRTPEEKFKLITQDLDDGNTDRSKTGEVLGADRLKKVLAERDAVAYWGTAPTGRREFFFLEQAGELVGVARDVVRHGSGAGACRGWVQWASEDGADGGLSPQLIWVTLSLSPRLPTSSALA
jgi:hypothetical protein